MLERDDSERQEPQTVVSRYPLLLARGRKLPATITVVNPESCLQNIVQLQELKNYRAIPAVGLLVYVCSSDVSGGT